LPSCRFGVGLKGYWQISWFAATPKTIGIVLCSEKNDAMVKITLPEDDGHVLAARYQMHLPTEEELRAEVTGERREAERAVRLAAATRHANDSHE